MNLEAARTQMIDQQIRAWEVLDPRVLQVMADVPRERFVPEALKQVAFADGIIPLAHGQVMMAPCVEGRLLQALNVGDTDTVLEIGTGSGFLTACLARLAQSVTSLDYFEDFTRVAKEKLTSLGLKNITLGTADATHLESAKRYDVIAVTGSTPTRESAILEALKPGGRLFVIEGSEPLMEARLITRLSESEYAEESLFETHIPALINSVAPSKFIL